jgi:hypothetical protein
MHARAVMTEVEQVIRGAFEPEDNVHQNVKA